MAEFHKNTNKALERVVERARALGFLRRFGSNLTRKNDGIDVSMPCVSDLAMHERLARDLLDQAIDFWLQEAILESTEKP